VKKYALLDDDDGEFKVGVTRGQLHNSRKATSAEHKKHSCTTRLLFPSLHCRDPFLLHTEPTQPQAAQSPPSFLSYTSPSPLMSTTPPPPLPSPPPHPPNEDEATELPSLVPEATLAREPPSLAPPPPPLPPSAPPSHYLPQLPHPSHNPASSINYVQARPTTAIPIPLPPLIMPYMDMAHAGKFSCLR